VHVKFGQAQALLAGDALQALAFELLTPGPDVVPPVQQAALCRLLARSAGHAGMAGGQAIDLAAVGVRLDRQALEDMHRRKTGAMLRASVRLGAWCGEAFDATDAGGAAALERYCDAVGLAFQVVDDILDVESDTATLGKTAGKDSKQNKPTYVSTLGMAAARDLARRLRDDAHEALAGFGAGATRLAQLADLIVLRRS
jgi:farnesyl diphosphate synthase